MEISMVQYFELLNGMQGRGYIAFKSYFLSFKFFSSIIDRIKNMAATAPAGIANKDITNQPVVVVIADDDTDDRELFEEAVIEINSTIKVQAVQDGLKLMNVLNEPGATLPDILFLDLNMPGKTGKECLREIKNNNRLKDLPVVIYSTSANILDIKETQGIGANLYIRKPDSFNAQVAVIKKVFSLDLEKLTPNRPLHSFVLPSDNL